MYEVERLSVCQVDSRYQASVHLQDLCYSEQYSHWTIPCTVNVAAALVVQLMLQPH